MPPDTLPRLAFFLVLAGVLSCGRSPTPPRPSLLLITVDTARADAYGCYGGRAATPVTDGLASEGIQFLQAIAPVPITHPSHASLLTGLYPQRHGIRDNGMFRLSSELDTLAERLRVAGYRTSAFVSSVVLDSRYGLDQGFETYDDAILPDVNPDERRGDLTVNAAIAYLDTLAAGAPLFMWVHLFDPHHPYAPPPPFDSTCHDSPYHGEIAFADQQIGRLVDKFRECRNHVYIVVTSDHGEGLGDHGEVTHGLFLYQETVRVPLIVVGPDLPRAVEVDALVSTIDLFATLLAFAGLEPPSDTDAHSLMDVLSSGTRQAPVLLETLLPHYTYGWSSYLGATDDRYKLIQGVQRELYDLKEDPGETRNHAEIQPEAMNRLADWISGMMKRPPLANPDAVALDAETRRSLESLGYLSAPSPAANSDYMGGPDPKEMAPYERLLMQGKALLDQGQLAEAITIFQRIVSQDPGNPIFREYLGRSLTLRGSYPEARKHLEKALEKRPDRPVAVFNLGLCHQALGDLAHAEAAYRTTLKLWPHHVGATFRLGELMLAHGRKEEARKWFQDCVEHHPDTKMAEVARQRLRELGGG
ncbi:MAG: sulfatase-like hydrolase/transferase [Planctomycetota bacterium]